MEQERYSILIIDDQIFAVNALRKRIEIHNKLELIGYETNPLIAIEKILKGILKPDLVLLDIEMPEMSGFDVADKLAEFTHSIFVTGHERYALEAFEHEVEDFIVKDVSKERFDKSIEKAIRQIELKKKATQAKPNDTILLRIERRDERFDRNKIDYFEALDYLTKIYFSDKSIKIISKKMKDIEEYLLSQGFARIHKSFIVNLDLVAAISANSVILQSGEQLPIGRAYKAGFLLQFSRNGS